MGTWLISDNPVPLQPVRHLTQPCPDSPPDPDGSPERTGARRAISVGGDTTGHPVDPGLVCLECGAELTYKGKGRRPRYSSNTCRHRAWERRRAAADGTVAKEVVELPALPMEPTYTRRGVLTWLRDNPGRLASAVAALPDTEESVRILDAARSRLWQEGVRTDSEVRAASQERQELDRLTELYRQALGRVESLRVDNNRLKGQLAVTREALDAPRGTAEQPGHPVPQSAAAGVGLSRRAGQAAPERSAPPGHKAMMVAGRTFHVPAEWSRTMSSGTRGVIGPPPVAAGADACAAPPGRGRGGI